VIGARNGFLASNGLGQEIHNISCMENNMHSFLNLSNKAVCNIFSPLLNWELTHEGALLCYVFFCCQSYKPKEGGNLYFCVIGAYISTAEASCGRTQD